MEYMHSGDKTGLKHKYHRKSGNWIDIKDIIYHFGIPKQCVITSKLSKRSKCFLIDAISVSKRYFLLMYLKKRKVANVIVYWKGHLAKISFWGAQTGRTNNLVSYLIFRESLNFSLYCKNNIRIIRNIKSVSRAYTIES